MAKELVSTHVYLGSAHAVPPGQGRCYVVGSLEIAVFRQRDGKIFATENLCPHRQGPLSEGLVGDGKVICPLHGHKFQFEDGKGSEPGECVRTYAVDETDGHLMLSLEDERRS
jgi:nitrite reductase (NADH) small subunit